MLKINHIYIKWKTLKYGRGGRLRESPSLLRTLTKLQKFLILDCLEVLIISLNVRRLQFFCVKFTSQNGILFYMVLEICIEEDNCVHHQYQHLHIKDSFDFLLGYETTSHILLAVYDFPRVRSSTSEWQLSIQYLPGSLNWQTFPFKWTTKFEKFWER